MSDPYAVYQHPHDPYMRIVPAPTPHPSYTAMVAAWDPERREQARVALARSIDKHTRPTIIRDISKQKRPKR